MIPELQLRKDLYDYLKERTDTANSDDFKKVNPLIQDMSVVEINAVKSLIGIMTVRIGLEKSVKEQEEKPDEKTAEKESK